MTDNVTNFTGTTVGHVSPPKVLEAAINAKLDEVLVLGMQDGELYAASSTGKLKDLLELIELFKFDLMSGFYA